MDDDELEIPPEVPPRVATAAPRAKEPFIPGGHVSTLLHGIRLPLVQKVTGMVMLDHLDVGSEAAERAHSYTARGPGRRIERDFLFPADNISFREDGRVGTANETFIVKVAPGQDNFLIKAYDTVSPNQAVKVRIDGQSAGVWNAPSGSPDRYGEVVLPLRAAFVGRRSQLRFELEPVSSDAELNGFAYWVFVRPGQQLNAPLRTDVAGLWLTDQLDVGNLVDEGKHDYTIEAATFGGYQQFEWPEGGHSFIEDGRATASYEAFAMTVIPGRDHLLVKAFDTYSKGQTVRVLIDRRLVGEWALPDGPARYGEGAFSIPAEFVGTRRQVNVRIEFVSASLEFNSFRYWMFANPGAP